MKRSRPGFLALATLVAGCAVSEGDDAAFDDGGGKGDGVTTPAYASATTVEETAAALTSAAPGLGVHLRPMGSLGHYGPISEYGPLGVLGPVGGSGWNPSTWIGLGWDAWGSLATAVRGPLTAAGPLGSTGPLNTAWWTGQVDGDVGEHLQPGGAATPLGPVGPLGALGPLGPLGPIGAHGFRRDSSGNYTGDCNGDGGTAVCREVDVEWTDGGSVRTWPLFENYPESTARAKTDNDTSFMVQGEIARTGDTDTFVANSADAQWVTIVAVPEHAMHTYSQAMAILAASSVLGFNPPVFVPFPPGYLYNHEASFDDFDLEVVVRGVGTAVSATAGTIDWATVRVPAGSTLEIKLTLYSAWSQWWRPYNPRYRLFVVGSTKYLAGAAATGPQLQALD